MVKIGIDFGTTNSLVSYVADNKIFSFLESNTAKSHPSVVWYKGLDEVVVGEAAKKQMNNDDVSTSGGFVRSPKMYLGKKSVRVGGVDKDPVEIVSEIFKHLKSDICDRDEKYDIDYDDVVITIPVSWNGKQRTDLRTAAEKAGIKIGKFVHEPLSALYGFLKKGYSGRLDDLEKKYMLVFDWGGGTLDLTLCQYYQGGLAQVLNHGIYDVGGDRFDNVVKDIVTEKAERTGSRLELATEINLIYNCEVMKIQLSKKDIAHTHIEKIGEISVSREEYEAKIENIIEKGVKAIDSLLRKVGLDRNSIEFCLATGGMVATPAIQKALRLRFDRVFIPENAITLVSEGSAWIANDAPEICLSKSFEVLNADNQYFSLIKSNERVFKDGRESFKFTTTMYCVNPKDLEAFFFFARSKMPFDLNQLDEKIPYNYLSIPVDPNAQPFQQELKLEIIGC